MSWHQDDPEFEDDLDAADAVIYLLRHSNGKLYQVKVVDRTEEGGLIFEVEAILVPKIFPERNIDSRYLKSYGYEFFIVPRPNAWSH